MYEEQRSIEDVGEMFEAIEQAETVTEMNTLRVACVDLMKQDKNVLLTWQKKYWSLKNCSSCGQSMP